MDRPWLQIIGLGKDGLPGLSDASRKAIAAAEVIIGGPRHLELAQAGPRGQAWPVPFDVAPVLALRGRAVVVLASGYPSGSARAAALYRIWPPANGWHIPCRPPSLKLRPAWAGHWKAWPATACTPRPIPACAAIFTMTPA